MRIKYCCSGIVGEAIARDEEENLKSYTLENLTLLCPHCNQHVKRDRLLEWNTDLLLKRKEVKGAFLYPISRVVSCPDA